jgi:hypothetical protein
MRKTLLALLLLGGSAFAGSNFYFGVNVGPPVYPGYAYPGYYVAAPPPPVPVMVVPASPGYGYAWVPGYWVPAGRNYRWVNGSWNRPRAARVKWVAPKYKKNRYYPGYWR